MTQDNAFQTAVQRLLDRYVELYSAKNAEALTELYTEDAAIYSPYGPPAIGRRAILTLHRSWLSEDEDNKRMKMIDARCDGDLAYCVSSYAGDHVGEDGTIETESGVSVHALIRQKDGSWKFQVSSLTRDDAANA